MVIKRISSVLFAIAFLMAIVLFAEVGRDYISVSTARIIFIAAGAIALILNLFNFQSSKGNTVFSLAFWLGSVVLFTGLVFQLMHWPYHRVIIITGLVVTGVSYFLSPNLLSGKPDKTDVLDDLDN